MPVSLNRLLSDNLPVDPTKNTFIGNGSQTVFNLDGQVILGLNNPNNLIVTLDGATQEPNIDYSINNSQITFTTAPDAGAKVVVIYRNAPYIIGSTIVTDGSVTSQKIAGANVTPDKLSTGAPVWNSSGNVALGHNSPATNLHLNYSNYGAILLGANNATGFTITKETPANTFNIWTGTIGSGTNRLCMTSSGDIGIGGITSPQSKLDIHGAIGFGLRSGGQNQPGYLSNIWSNTDGYRFFTLGSSYFNGTSWITNVGASFGSNNVCVINGDPNGVSINLNAATGNTQRTDSTATFNSFEKLRVNIDGSINTFNNPINNCPTTAKAHIVFMPDRIQTVYSNAPANVYIEAFPNGNIGYWYGFSAGWVWTKRSEGLVYWLRLGGVSQTIAGVPTDGNIGVPIKLRNQINNNQIEFEWLTGIPNVNVPTQVAIGNGSSEGFTYITNGIKESYNIGALVRNGMGDYTVYFTNPMANRDFIFCGGTTMEGNQNNWISGRNNLGALEDVKENNYLRFSVTYSDRLYATIENGDVTLVVFSNA